MCNIFDKVLLLSVDICFHTNSEARQRQFTHKLRSAAASIIFRSTDNKLKFISLSPCVYFKASKNIPATSFLLALARR